MDEWNDPIEAVVSDQPHNKSAGAVDPGWKDELNLAEFPIASLSDRIPDGQTTLVFEDRLERRDSPPIVRRLTIMGTHKHGLPTSLDDEVLVGLIQLTKRRSNFTDQRVHFSRYELIELLGWPRSGQSYRRIEESLFRWVGVVLMYENAWWDNLAKSWVDEQFHVLDNVTLYDRERWRTKSRTLKPTASTNPRSKDDKPPLPLSSFRWNEVIFQSFQSGNLKQLDLEFYLNLRLPTTKRMYRFLDKRFYRRQRLDFDLRTLACEHIGLSRLYAPTELKRRLKPALEELEELGFLTPMPPSERYVYVKRGSWRIILVRAGESPAAERAGTDLDPEQAAVVEALKTRGVTAKSALELVGGRSAAGLQAKIEVFDWLTKKGDKRVAKNPAGFLVASIRGDYQTPGDYPPVQNGARQGTLPISATAPNGPTESDQLEAARDAQLRAAWDQAPEPQRAAIIAQVKAQNPSLGRWWKMLEPLCLLELESRLNPKNEPEERFVLGESGSN